LLPKGRKKPQQFSENIAILLKKYPFVSICRSECKHKKLVKRKGFWKINAIRPKIKARWGRMRKFNLGQKANWGGMAKELGF
jgi:hypothetical protein